MQSADAWRNLYDGKWRGGNGSVELTLPAGTDEGVASNVAMTNTSKHWRAKNVRECVVLGECVCERERDSETAPSWVCARLP